MNPNIFWLLLVVSLSLIHGCQHKRTELGAPPPRVESVSTPIAPKLIDFNVGGLRLGDSEAAVLKHLGKPRKRTISDEDMCGISPILILGYPGIEFWLDRATGGKETDWAVLEIRVNASEIVIEPGARIGDTSESIRQRLGHPWIEKEHEGSIIYYYLTKDNDNAQLEFKGGHLGSIRLYINPC